VLLYSGDPFRGVYHLIPLQDCHCCRVPRDQHTGCQNAAVTKQASGNNIFPITVTTIVATSATKGRSCHANNTDNAEEEEEDLFVSAR
jgi:hypothetical protein